MMNHELQSFRAAPESKDRSPGQIGLAKAYMKLTVDEVPIAWSRSQFGNEPQRQQRILDTRPDAAPCLNSHF